MGELPGVRRGELRVYDDQSDCFGPYDGCESVVNHITRSDSVIYFALVLLVVVVPSVLSFRQRDLP